MMSKKLCFSLCGDIFLIKLFQRGFRSCAFRSIKYGMPSNSHQSNQIFPRNHQLFLKNYFCSCVSSDDLSTSKSETLGKGKKNILSPHSLFSEKLLDPFSTALVETNPQKTLYHDLIDDFPDGIQMAFAYGSGAIQQNNSKQMSQNMLDFIFVVDKPKRWHRLNLQRHPHHYSQLRRFGPRVITKVQDSYGAGVYFNTLVPMHGRLIKYGVISTARLITDLLDWETLYISGRLHKPVTLVIVPTDEELIKALRVNLESALHSALILLPDMFSEEQFYMTIAGLSYAGDIRMAFSEDRNKVKNIVLPNVSQFRQLYLPLVTNQEHVTFWLEEGQLEQALTADSRHHHLTRLPCQVLHGLLMQKYQVGVFPDLEEIIHLNAHDSECGLNISRSINHIVKRSSLSQTLKGLLMAGLTKSIRYAFSKIMKRFRSR